MSTAMKNKLIFGLLCLCLPITLSQIKIGSDGGYTDVVITISSSVSYSEDFLPTLQEFFTQVNEQLFIATFNQTYIKSIVLVLPNSWPVEDAVTSSFILTNSDIKIDSGNVLFPNENIPYTQQPRSCGEKGNFIYLTTDYIKEWNDTKDNVIVKKFIQGWAKLRYGVFEEISDKNFAAFPEFYIDQDGEKKTTGCAFPDPFFQKCDTVDEVLQCSEFQLNETLLPVHSSIMGDLSLNASVFCNDFGDNLHNSKAPTRHNALCKRKSTWQIISQSVDFSTISEINVPNQEITMDIFKPNVTLVKMAPQAVVIVIDPLFFETSKNSLLWYSVYQFIQLLPQNSSLGVVKADTETKELAITSTFDSSYMFGLKQFIRNASSSTRSLKQGMSKAIQMLQDKPNKTKHIILLASGPDLKPDSTFSSIQEHLQNNSLTFSLLTWTEENIQLKYTYESMKIFTDYQYNSLWFNIPIPTSKNQCNLTHRYLMDNAFVEHFNRFDTHNLQSKSIKMKTETGGKGVFEIPKENATINFKTFYCNSDLIDERLTINKKYYFDFIRDLEGFATSYLWKSNLPEKSRVEFEWKIDDESFRKKHQTSLWFVTNSILLTGQLEKSKDISLPNILYGYYSGDLEIKAKVVTPNGTVEYIELRDNGNGDPDVKAKDGIFSRYFIYPNMEHGMHSISIIATDSTGETLLQTDLGTFIIPLIDVDKIPPNWIGDFHIKSVDFDNDIVSFQWTEPGGDFDHNSVTFYFLNCAINITSTFEENIGEQLPITPQESGKEKIYNWKIINPNTLYYCGVWSMDNSNNTSEISNIITIYIPEEPTTTTTTTTAVPETLSTFNSGEQTQSEILHQFTTQPSQIDVIVTLMNVTSTEGTNLTKEEHENDIISTGEISAIVVACIVILIILIILSIVLYKRKAKAKTKRNFIPQLSTIPNNRADIIRAPSNRSSIVDVDSISNDITANTTSNFNPESSFKSKTKKQAQLNQNSKFQQELANTLPVYQTSFDEREMNVDGDDDSDNDMENINYATLSFNRNITPTAPSSVSTFVRTAPVKNAPNLDELYSKVDKRRKQYAEPQAPRKKIISVTQV